MEKLNEAMVWVGYIALVYFAIKMIRLFVHVMRVYYVTNYPDFSKYGKWSVITGSTAGIGKAVAFQLASRGQNIILIARNEQKLETVSNEIKTKYNVEVQTIQVDFSEDETIYKTIEDALKELDIGVLINNVGTVGTKPEIFGEINNLSDAIRIITRVNIMSMLKMTQIVLPGMVLRKRGLIMNMSSGVGNIPSAAFSLYGASKSFITYFSQTLRYEYEDKGITVQTCIAGEVSTALSNFDEVSMVVLTPDDFAKALISTMYQERVTYGCLPHFLLVI